MTRNSCFDPKLRAISLLVILHDYEGRRPKSAPARSSEIVVQIKLLEIVIEKRASIYDVLSYFLFLRFRRDLKDSWCERKLREGRTVLSVACAGAARSMG